jgi:hypothetical protein
MGKAKRHDAYKYDLAYEASEEQKRRRAERNKDRRQAIREGRVRKGDTQDIHHIEGIKGPIKVINRSRNRSIK